MDTKIKNMRKIEEGWAAHKHALSLIQTLNQSHGVLTPTAAVAVAVATKSARDWAVGTQWLAGRSCLNGTALCDADGRRAAASVRTMVIILLRKQAGTT